MQSRDLDTVLRFIVLLLFIVGCLVMLAGCFGAGAPPPKVLTRTEIVKCPVLPPPDPEIACPRLPDLGPAPTRDALADAWIDAHPHFARCRQAVIDGRRGWDECGKAEPR